MEIKKYEIEWIILFAFRYALGRMSMATSIICDVITRNKTKMNKHIIKNMIYEIEYADRNAFIGDDADRREWMDLKEELEWVVTQK